MKKNNNSDLKRKITAGITAAVMGAGILVNKGIRDPKDLIRPDIHDDPDPHVYTLDHIEEHRNIIETEEYEPYTLLESICVWMLEQPLIIRAFVLLPLWGIGEILSVLFSSLIASPVIQGILHFILGIICLSLLFVLVIKLLFPYVKLRDILKPGNILLIILASALITVTDTLLGLYFERWKIWRIVIKAVTGLMILMLLIKKIMGKLKAPERRKKFVEIIID